MFRVLGDMPPGIWGAWDTGVASDIRLAVLRAPGIFFSSSSLGYALATALIIYFGGVPKFMWTKMIRWKFNGGYSGRTDNR